MKKCPQLALRAFQEIVAVLRGVSRTSTERPLLAAVNRHGRFA